MENKKMVFCVIMSVYSGKRYIKEQLDSIFLQHFNGQIVVYIRDDGSPDNTFSYLEDYKKEFGKQIILVKGENKGASGSFLDALRNAPEADYYAFCDQDDIWLQGKVETSINAIKKYSASEPVLWASNYTVVDSKLNIISSDVLKTPINNDLRAIFYNNVPGCTMVFNHALLNEMRKVQVERIRMHDIMAINVALVSGTLVFEPRTFILYRQHGNNVLGYGHKRIKPLKWVRDKIKLLLEKEPYDISEYAIQILNNFARQLSDQQRENYELISKYKTSIWNRINLLKKDFTKAPFNRTTISIRIKIFFKLM